MFFKSVYIKYKIVLPLKLVFITVFFAITENINKLHDSTMKKKILSFNKKNNKLEWYCCKFYNTIHKDEERGW